MEDRPPLGTLDRDDLVAHQLEGVPEMLSLGELLAQRNNPRFDLLRVAHQQHQADLIVGGDVMLGRTVGEQIQAGADPFAGIRGYLDGAPWKFVNLECVISDQGAATSRESRTAFALPPRRPASSLRPGSMPSAWPIITRPILGATRCIDSIARLKANDIAVVGAAETPELAYAPHFFTARDGRKAALIALSDVEDDRSDATDRAGVGSRPRGAGHRGSARQRPGSSCASCIGAMRTRRG